MSEPSARREFKFLLKRQQAESLAVAIRENLASDVNGDEGSYPIVSEYYDTAGRDALWDRERNIGNRRKLRVRMYGSNDGSIPPSAFIEIKHKQGRDGAKRRLAVPVESLSARDFCIRSLIGSLQPSQGARRDLLLVEEVNRLLEGCRVEPSIQMRYDRQAFQSPDGSVRVTMDHAIRCREVRRPLLPDDPDFPFEVIPADESLLEVKLLGAAPYWLRNMAAGFRLTRIPFSKYCTAIRAHARAVSSSSKPLHASR